MPTIERFVAYFWFLDNILLFKLRKSDLPGLKILFDVKNVIEINKVLSYTKTTKDL